MPVMRSLVLIVCLCGWAVAEVPAHIKLAYGTTDSQMQVTFASSSQCAVPYVLYGASSGALTFNQSAVTIHFSYGNELGYQYVYNALLDGLTQGNTYYYACFCDNAKSDLFHFTAKPSGNNWSPNILVYGDMGRTLGPQALPSLINEVKSGWADVAIHNGDFAYNMDTAGGTEGDLFMNQIEPMSAYIPYMVSVGNHEAGYNFTNYVNRFKMPSQSQNMWYSWDLSTVHFLVYSTEVYFYDTVWDPAVQYKWLEQDLIAANANRNSTPWIIAYGHRPMYASNSITYGNISLVKDELESLFYKYGVDIILEAHEHSYERMWPVYNGTVTQTDYINPKAPVHFVTGVAGCNEELGVCVNPIDGPKGPWSAFHASGKSAYGYAKMQVANSTHVLWEEIEVVSNTTIDSVWIVQTQHGSF